LIFPPKKIIAIKAQSGPTMQADKLTRQQTID
jgi:hypothetical protein